MKRLLLHICMLMTMSIFAGCAKFETEPLPADDAIAFSADITRATTSSLGIGDEFDIWGSMTKYGTTGPILSQERVYNTSGSWQYDKTAYWFDAATYSFRALHPHNIPNVAFVTTSSSPYITITNFDATKNTDLLIAKRDNIMYLKANNPSTTVGLTFSHMLSRLEFEGKSNIPGTIIDIKSVKLFGLATTASYNEQTNTWTMGSSLTTATNPNAQAAASTITSLGSTLMTDVTVVPQTIGDSIILSITYTDDTGEKTINSKLSEADLSAWEAGKSYRYTFTIQPNQNIVFNKPQIIGWEHATGGIIVVD